MNTSSSPGQEAFGLVLARPVVEEERLLSFPVGGGEYKCCLWRLIALASQ